MAEDRISVRLDKEKIEFLEQVGHDPAKEKGARTRGVEAVIAFAQGMPTTFALWMKGAPVTWGHVDEMAAFAIAREVSKCDVNA